MFIIFSFIFAVFLLYSFQKWARRCISKPTFHGKNVWITGASSGIGEYLAYEFNELGANLFITARGLEQLQRVKSSCKYPDRVKVIKLDMTNYQQIQSVTSNVIRQLQQNGQKLDIVIQNAGISMRCLFQQYSFNNHLMMQSVNVHGPFRHIQCLLEHMIKNKNGHIVGITSIAGKLASSHRSSYAGSKHAFIGILDSLRTQLHQHGISVTNIMPGYINTNLSKNALVSGEGQKLGFTDKNIASGLSPTSFAKTAAKAIYNKQNQLEISGTILMPLMICLRNLCPDLSFLILKINGKNQADAISKK